MSSKGVYLLVRNSERHLLLGNTLTDAQAHLMFIGAHRQLLFLYPVLTLEKEGIPVDFGILPASKEVVI